MVNTCEFLKLKISFLQSLAFAVIVIDFLWLQFRLSYHLHRALISQHFRAGFVGIGFDDFEPKKVHILKHKVE